MYGLGRPRGFWEFCDAMVLALQLQVRPHENNKCRLLLLAGWLRCG